MRWELFAEALQKRIGVRYEALFHHWRWQRNALCELSRSLIVSSLWIRRSDCSLQVAVLAAWISRDEVSRQSWPAQSELRCLEYNGQIFARANRTAYVTGNNDRARIFDTFLIREHSFHAECNCWVSMQPVHSDITNVALLAETSFNTPTIFSHSVFSVARCSSCVS